MKIMMILIAALLTFNANASLITINTTQTSVLAGDTVLVELLVNDINPDAAEIGFDLSFDDSTLSFDQFTFSDPVFFSSIFGNASIFGASDLVTIFTTWLDSADVPGTSFSLGEAQFTALSDINSSSFGIENLVVSDNNFNVITPQADISEPQMLLLFLLACLMLNLARKKAK